MARRLQQDMWNYPWTGSRLGSWLLSGLVVLFGLLLVIEGVASWYVGVIPLFVYLHWTFTELYLRLIDYEPIEAYSE